MVVLVAGADGYIGFCISMHLANSGFDVVGVDNFCRRRVVKEVGAQSITPISSISERLSAFEKEFGKKILFEYGDLRDYNFVSHLLKKHKPDTIFHLGQLTSAPYSMLSAQKASLTQSNNIVGNLNILHAIRDYVPKCKLIKMGSMGEYGTPNIDIPEGNFEIEYNGRKDSLPFPKNALTDWYHWSKAHDSGNTQLACDIWKLSATDIMQGVVYGIETEETVNDSLLTRFDIDPFFGTVLNRFCAQAVIGKKLTIYGNGGQKRPFMSLQNVIQCLKLSLDNPPANGEYRIINQFNELYNIVELANKVQKCGATLGLEVETEKITNPRIESEKVDYFNPINKKIFDMGFSPKQNMDKTMIEILSNIMKYKSRIEKIKL